jgi:hypothetical protein
MAGFLSRITPLVPLARPRATSPAFTETTGGDVDMAYAHISDQDALYYRLDDQPFSHTSLDTISQTISQAIPSLTDDRFERKLISLQRNPMLMHSVSGIRATKQLRPDIAKYPLGRSDMQNDAFSPSVANCTLAVLPLRPFEV